MIPAAVAKPYADAEIRMAIIDLRLRRTIERDEDGQARCNATFAVGRSGPTGPRVGEVALTGEGSGIHRRGSFRKEGPGLKRKKKEK